MNGTMRRSVAVEVRDTLHLTYHGQLRLGEASRGMTHDVSAKGAISLGGLRRCERETSFPARCTLLS